MPHGLNNCLTRHFRCMRQVNRLLPWPKGPSFLGHLVRNLNLGQDNPCVPSICTSFPRKTVVVFHIVTVDQLPHWTVKKGAGSGAHAGVGDPNPQRRRETHEPRPKSPHCGSGLRRRGELFGLGACEIKIMNDHDRLRSC